MDSGKVFREVALFAAIIAVGLAMIYLIVNGPPSFLTGEGGGENTAPSEWTTPDDAPSIGPGSRSPGGGGTPTPRPTPAPGIGDSGGDGDGGDSVEIGRVRRKEQTAWRLTVNGTIQGKGTNLVWADIQGFAEFDFGRSSYNTYMYSAEIDVHLHVNTPDRLEIDYVFRKIQAQEFISDREISIDLDSRFIPPLMPSSVKITEDQIREVEDRVRMMGPALPAGASDWIQTAGKVLAFRAQDLERANETAMGLNGRTVRVVKSLGGTRVTSTDDFQPTRAQREFIERMSLSADFDLFPDDKRPGQRWTADAETLGFVFDPLMPGDFRGPVEIEYQRDTREGGVTFAELAIRRAPVQFVATEEDARGKFNGVGEIECLMPGRLVTRLSVNGNGEFRGFPKKHLLYGMSYEGAPEYNAVSQTEPIRYKENP